MSYFSSAYSDDRQRNAGERSPRERARWRPLEIVAIVLGFVVWWPIGLALLLWKLWRNKTGRTEDIVSVARGAFEEKVMKRWPEVSRSWGARSAAPARDWGFGGYRSSGNSAFDAWREGELARLEEERRKLEAAEREFSDYIESLRRAKDREEFERFMRDRNSGGQPQDRPNA